MLQSNKHKILLKIGTKTDFRMIISQLFTPHCALNRTFLIQTLGA